MSRTQDLPITTCAVLPTYNNERTLDDIIRRTLRQVPHVIVVDDGSQLATARILDAWKQDERVTTVAYLPNRGKGYALRTGLRKARQMGFRQAITLDTDGQHFPEDIPQLLREAAEHPGALVVGTRNLNEERMPRGNTFANRFSNFWFRLQTGVSLADTQSGFRLYPLDHIKERWAVTPRYEAELELLVLAAWNGVEIRQVPVRVYYPPKDERVSHFRPVADFARISVLNTLLCLLAPFFRIRCKLRKHH